MPTSAMAMSMAVMSEEHKTNDIDNQTSYAHPKHPLRVVDRVIVDHALNGFHKYSEAEGNQEDSVGCCT